MEAFFQCVAQFPKVHAFVSGVVFLQSGQLFPVILGQFQMFFPGKFLGSFR